MKWDRVCRHCGRGDGSVIWEPGVGWYCHQCGKPYKGLPEPPDLWQERNEARNVAELLAYQLEAWVKDDPQHATIWLRDAIQDVRDCRALPEVEWPETTDG